jgi:hypothetical protein
MIQNRFAGLVGFSLLAWFIFVGSARLRADTAEAQPTTHPAGHIEQFLRAGPISLKFEDGELRYLRVGNREIVRRVYFGVREAKFSATDMPKFSEMHIESAEDHFAIHFSAACRGKTVAFNWTGDITGTADGKINYRAAGSAPADGMSARIGLCVLFGMPTVVGHAFETIGDDINKPTPGQFPKLVSAALVASNFRTLQYAIDGVQVSCSIPESPFYMEDQRTWGDTSFKAYNSLPYAYPKIEKDKTLSQTLTISVKDLPLPATEPTTVPTTSPADNAIHVRIGAPITSARVCALTTPDRFPTALSFGTLNGHRDKYAQETAIAWNWTTATHLPDEDTAMDNTPTIIDQAKTIRSFAPRALLRVGPISVNGGWPALNRPPGFDAAWTTSAIHALSLANVDEAAFQNPDPQAERILSVFKEIAGKPVASVDVSGSTSIDAFAVNDIGTTTLWLVNRTDQAKMLVLENLPAGARPASSNPALSDESFPLQGDHVELAPYDVRKIVIPQ